MGNNGVIRFGRRQAESLSGPIMECLRSSGLYDGLVRNKVFELWDSLSGANRFTINKYLKDNILYITISSSALRNKLQYQLPVILAKINESLSSDELFAGNSLLKIVLR